MPNRTRQLYEASRLVTWIHTEVGRELRLARVSAGLRQIDVAKAIGTSKSRICRVEHGRIARLSVASISMHAAAVGLRPWLKLYPLAGRLLDKPQLQLLGRFRGRLHGSWTWETEVPMPIPGDLRSGDCRISIKGCAILVEAHSRFSDYQAQTARARRKKRDLEADRLIMLISATHANRAALSEARTIADGSFPLGTRQTMAALGAGRDPGADAIVLL